ncbi:uncharacterized protein MEPE_01130 [Melanopsichium pennsylvanicum]|uniref:Uncharacterized protein n=2 Tax=Melanopsichium pennsylvanicum TaxID=63383 RepID=A0AAJ5C3H0_9BASI|nr:uncharacterized protein BN887_01586 [Melanopsichium pennsylvanicum 4]SNX82424.1 uncharacterized protein MEPE_01130 [Melanopsichium pennsylvanicum]
MDGIGFMASLQATTLAQGGATQLSPEPMRRSTRSSPTFSVANKAKVFANKSRSFFSISSSSSTGSRNSLYSSSHSDHSHRGEDLRSPSTIDSRSFFALSTSSPLSGEKQPRGLHQPRSPLSSNVRSAGHLSSQQAVSRMKTKYQSGWHTETKFHADVDPSWILTLVDNGYVPPSPETIPVRFPSLGPDSNNSWEDSDIEPSRASSLLDHELVHISFDDGPRPSDTNLPPLMSLSVAEQVAISFGNQIDRHKHGTTDYQASLQSQTRTPSTRFWTSRSTRLERRRRPHTAT